FLVAMGAVMGAEPFARRSGIARALVLEDAFLVAWADIGVGDELEVSGVMLADEDAALVAGAYDAGLDRAIGEGAVGVAEIRCGGDGQRGAGGGEALHELPARHAHDRRPALGQLADGALEVRLADRFLLGGHIKCHDSSPSRIRPAHAGRSAPPIRSALPAFPGWVAKVREYQRSNRPARPSGRCGLSPGPAGRAFR